MLAAIQLSNSLAIDESEIELSAVRAQGAGGQNVNKVSSAIHLRFDIKASSLPECYKDRLLALRDQRISKDGVLIIKAQQYRTQEQNRQDALARLQSLIQQVMVPMKVRRATKPSKSSQRKRVEQKLQRAQTKSLRKAIKL